MEFLYDFLGSMLVGKGSVETYCAKAKDILVYGTFIAFLAQIALSQIAYYVLGSKLPIEMSASNLGQ